MKIGLVEDMEGFIVRSYGMKRENSGYSYRYMVLLDTTRVVVARMVMDLPIGLGGDGSSLADQGHQRPGGGGVYPPHQAVQEGGQHEGAEEGS